jgi:hypothetical protein
MAPPDRSSRGRLQAIARRGVTERGLEPDVGDRTRVELLDTDIDRGHIDFKLLGRA